MKEAIRKSEEKVFKEAVSRAKANREAATHNVPCMKMELKSFRMGMRGWPMGVADLRLRWTLT